MPSPSMGVWGDVSQVSLYFWSRLSSHLEDRSDRFQLLMGFSSSGMRVVESEIGLLLVVLFLALGAETGLGPVGLLKVSLGLSVSILILISICDIGLGSSGLTLSLLPGVDALRSL